MSSDEEHRSRRRHKDSRKRKEKRSGRLDSGSSRVGSSRSNAEEGSHERSGRRKTSSREAGGQSSRRSRRSRREEEEIPPTDIPNTREENIFTRGIPAPPLAAPGLSNESGLEKTIDDRYLEEDEKHFDDDDLVDNRNEIINGHRVMWGKDGNEDQDYAQGPEDKEDSKSRKPLEQPNSRMLLELREVLETCQWETFYDLVNKIRDDDVKVFCTSQNQELQPTPFHSIMGKAPAAISLFVLSLLETEASSLCMRRDAEGNTPLHLFCANVEVLGKRELLVLKQLAQGAPRSVPLSNSEGDTPMHLLVASHACSTTGQSTYAAAEKAVSILLEESRDAATIQDSSGATPLHVAISHGAFGRVLVKLLEAVPESSMVVDDQGMLPLHYAAAFWCGAPNFIENVLSANPDALTAITVNGDTPLHLLISNNPGESEKLDTSMIKIVELLVGLGGNDREPSPALGPIAIQNNEKLTPMHCCALFDAPHQITRAIMGHPLAKNASLIPNMFGATALHLAVAQQSVSVSIENVLALGTAEAAAAEDRLKRAPLHVAAQNVYATSKLISALYKLCPDAISMRTQRGHLPLHLAAQSQAKETVVKALLNADPKAAEVRNKSSNTPLHDAAKYRSSEGVVRLLLETYPDAVYVQNQYGNLPLHCATAYQALPEVIQLLLTAWSDGAAMQNRNQDAPLHYAAAYTTSVDAVRPLIDAAPAAVLLLNSSGQSPIDRARANGAPDEIVELLEESAKEWTKKASQDGWGEFSPDDEGAAGF